MTTPAPFVLVGGPMSDVQPERVAWLWLRRIPFGKLTVIDGDPGLAKSLLTLDLAARLSRGAPMPDGVAAETAPSIILTAEDGLGDTVRPRLDAMGADVSRVYSFTAATTAEGEEFAVTLPSHLAALRAQVEQLGVRFVVVDPLMAYLSLDVNTRIDHDVRRVLAQLARLAEDTAAAVVLVRHLNKATGGPALYRGGGSIGIIGAARSGLLVARDPDDETRRILATTKSNLAEEAPSLRFRVETAPNGAARLVWEGETPHRANALLAMPADDDERQEAHDIRAFLRDFLQTRRTAKEVQAACREAGFNVHDRTLRRAAKAIGADIQRHGFGPGGAWVWSLGAERRGHIEGVADSPRNMAPTSSMVPYETPAKLTVELVGPGVYRVVGGAQPHVVQIVPGAGARCDCPDFKHRGRRRDCKHLGAVSGLGAQARGLAWHIGRALRRGDLTRAERLAAIRREIVTALERLGGRP